MKNFQGKNILFFSAAFFNYEKAIVEKLQNLGANVDYFNERPSDSTLAKGMIRVNRSLYKRKIQNYYQNILDKTREKMYDFLLIIKGETVPDFFLKQFKIIHPKTKLIYYGYDPLSEYPEILKILPYFDKKLSFDREDAVKFQMQFRPLFFIDEYINKENSDFRYDLSFIGSAHTDRFLVGEMVENVAQKINLKTFFYYFAPSKSILLLKKLFDKHFEKLDVKKVSYHQFSHQEISEIYYQSKAVLDIQKPFQNGLTMRTFEVLASGRKLITTNEDIVNYLFYNPENILIINRENPVITAEFFEKPFVALSENQRSRMSLDAWLVDVFFDDEDYF